MKNSKLLFLLLPIAFTFFSCELPKHQVTFNLNYETEARETTLIVTHGKIIPPPDTPLRDNYFFVDWFLADAMIPFNFATEITRDITLYARWRDYDPSETYGAFTITDGSGNQIVGVNNVYTISQSGDYNFTGYLKGQIIFADTIDDSVNIYLNNTYLIHDGTPLLWEKETLKMEIRTVHGTSNYLISTGTINETPALDSNNNIELGGSGFLSVTSYSSHAIRGSDVLVKGNATIEVIALKDGIHAKSFIQVGSTLKVFPTTDAVETNLNKSGNKGFIEISGGTFISIGGNMGLKAETALSIFGTETVIQITEYLDAPYRYGTTIYIGEEVMIITE